LQQFKRRSFWGAVLIRGGTKNVRRFPFVSQHFPGPDALHSIFWDISMATYSVYSGGKNRSTQNLSNKINTAFQLNGDYLMCLTVTVVANTGNFQPFWPKSLCLLGSIFASSG
jgi:hypothetical protein